jgi:hypothetical protein
VISISVLARVALGRLTLADTDKRFNDARFARNYMFACGLA